MRAQAFLLLGCVALLACHPEELGQLTVVLKRGDVDPFSFPGDAEEPARPVTALRFSWDAPLVRWPADAGVITVALGSAAQQRLALPAPAEPGRLTVEGLLSGTGETWSLGRSVQTPPPQGSADARVTVVLGPADAPTPVGPALPSSPLGARAARLGDTGAVIVGGESPSADGGVTATFSAWRYDREALEATELEPTLRAGAFAVTLPSGRVLYGLGVGGDGRMRTDVFLVDLDGTPRAVTLGGLSLEGRSHAVALALSDGAVLLLGGRGAGGPLASVARLTVNETTAEVTVDAAPPLPVPLWRHAAAQLSTGEVLVAGGLTTNDVGNRAAWWLDLAAASPAWKTGGQLREDRLEPAVVRLEDDSVLLWGGGSDTGDVFSLVVEAMLPLSVVGATPRDGAALVRVGRSVLFLGGERGAEAPLAVRFVPDVQVPRVGQQYLGVWRALGPSTFRRRGAVAVQLGDQSVLLVGGGPSRLELFTPTDATLRGAVVVE
jgi:hypothetical protein